MSPSPNLFKPCPLQAEKVCGPHAGGPARLSSNPAVSHVPATAVTSERWAATAGPAVNQRLQDRSNRWDKLMWWDDTDTGLLLFTALHHAFVFFCCITPGLFYWRLLKETKVATWKSCQGKGIWNVCNVFYHQLHRLSSHWRCCNLTELWMTIVIRNK